MSRRPGLSFAAIDFETADYGRDSACSLGIVRVEEGVIAERFHTFIRPPRRDFVFTYLHGISWDDVATSPGFPGAWAKASTVLDGISFLAAHNAPFDRSVLLACCSRSRIPSPVWPFHCTVKLARAVWNVFPTKLPDVCRHLGIPLRHHDAISDAEACARIVLAAADSGITLSADGRRTMREAAKGGPR